MGAHLDIAHYSRDLLVNRGVMLDVARFVKGDLSPLPAAPPNGFEVTADLLADTARAHRVHIRRGDTVLVRTGWGQYFAGNPDLYKGDQSPGPSVGGAQWLIDRGAVVVGSDTLTFELRPPLLFDPEFRIFPVDTLVIAEHGVHIIENFHLEELAAARVYEFLLVVPPLKYVGATGSPLRSFALVPDL